VSNLPECNSGRGEETGSPRPEKVPGGKSAYDLAEKGAEATSKAQDDMPLPAALPEALGAGCAMNRFFNKLLECVS
jgi:hypothetical protein